MRNLILFVLLLSVPACSWLHKAADNAKPVVVDCGKGTLASLRPVAIAMVKPVLAGTITRDDLTTTAIQAGEQYGGCLLRHLHDVMPRPFGLVGAPTEAELALQRFREQTHTTAKYRTDSGTL